MKKNSFSAVVLTLLALFLSGCGSNLRVDISPDRACQIDNTGMNHIKAWGKCPNDTATCHLRWRFEGSTDPWVVGGTSRSRQQPRDSELEYGVICK